jgi:tetratricopeptide (TPR) repeat protein
MQSIASFLVGAAALAFIAVWFYRRIRNSTDPGDLTFKWIITAGCVLLWIYLGIQAKTAGVGGAFIIPGVAVATGILLSILWTPHIAAIVSSPLTKWYDGGDDEPELRPLYSIATAFRKRGQYDKAIAEIHKQLGRFPNDYQGYMMLAEVWAEDMKDLDEAMRTVESLLCIPNLAPKNAAYSLTRVADWLLKYRSDIDSARATFQRIIDRLPDSVEAQLAAQRIAHLASAEDLANMHDPRIIAVPHYDEKIGLQGRVVEAPITESVAVTAQRYVDHLREHPLDNETRERLAMIYANEYQRLDLASIELEQLITTPNQLPKNVIHWLNVLADFQIRLANDVNGARLSLERIITLFPNSAGANNAQTRISQLRLELNQHTTQRTLKLGNYEQNIGLRKMNSSGQMND